MALTNNITIEQGDCLCIHYHGKGVTTRLKAYFSFDTGGAEYLGDSYEGIASNISVHHNGKIIANNQPYDIKTLMAVFSIKWAK